MLEKLDSLQFQKQLKLLFVPAFCQPWLYLLSCVLFKPGKTELRQTKGAFLCQNRERMFYESNESTSQ